MFLLFGRIWDLVKRIRIYRQRNSNSIIQSWLHRKNSRGGAKLVVGVLLLKEGFEFYGTKIYQSIRYNTKS